MRIYPITLLTVLFSALVVAPGANAYAQNKVKTETIQVAPVDETEGDTGTEGTSEEPAADTSEDDADRKSVV